MQYINVISNWLASILLAPLEGKNAWPALVWASFLSTFVFLLVFKFGSNQARIERKKRRLISRVLELVLFRHDLLVSLTACGRILQANLSYLFEFLKPLALGAIPGLLILLQLACWFDMRPLRVGESALLEVDFRPDVVVMNQSEIRVTATNMRVETAALRIPSLHQMNWLLRANATGPGTVEITTIEGTVEKQSVVSDRLVKVSSRRSAPAFWSELTAPAEPPLPTTSLISQITLRYPPRQLYIGNSEIDWVWAFFLLTLLFGLLLMRPLGVRLL